MSRDRNQELLDETYLRDLEREDRLRHTPAQRRMQRTRMSCGHELVFYADDPEGLKARCPHCERIVRIERNPDA